jgi:hypothetical protein
VIVALLGALTAVLLVTLFVRLANKSGGQQKTTFVVGKTSVLAKEAAKAPLLFQDALNRGRDIYVIHNGSDRLAGWVAFLAHAPDADRTCQLVWQAASHDFRDPCDSHVYPGDGGSLPHYPTTVDPKGSLSVDLRTPVS